MSQYQEVEEVRDPKARKEAEGPALLRVLWYRDRFPYPPFRSPDRGKIFVILCLWCIHDRKQCHILQSRTYFVVYHDNPRTHGYLSVTNDDVFQEKRTQSL